MIFKVDGTIDTDMPVLVIACKKIDTIVKTLYESKVFIEFVIPFMEIEENTSLLVKFVTVVLLTDNRSAFEQKFENKSVYVRVYNYYESIHPREGCNRLICTIENTCDRRYNFSINSMDKYPRKGRWAVGKLGWIVFDNGNMTTSNTSFIVDGKKTYTHMKILKRDEILICENDKERYVYFMERLNYILGM
jgi:hypothetical protein